MNERYPGWLLANVGKNHTVKQWLEIIADYYYDDFTPGYHGRPSKLTRETAIRLFGEYANSGHMVYASDALGIHRYSEWRWRKQYQSVHDMHVLVSAYIQQMKTRYPSDWNMTRHQRVAILRRKRGVQNVPMERQWGRPSEYRKEYSLMVEPTLSATAKRLGVAKQTIINWMKEYPELKLKILMKRFKII